MCEQYHRVEVAENFIFLSKGEKEGPITLFFSLRSSDNGKASEGYIAKGFQGQNKFTVVSQFHTSIYRLPLSDKLPVDIVKCLFLTFQTSSIPDFNDLLRMIFLKCHGNNNLS